MAKVKPAPRPRLEILRLIRKIPDLTKSRIAVIINITLEGITYEIVNCTC